jgi:hypothetical protein
LGNVGQFINHNDKIGKGKLDDSLKEVESLYNKEFMEAYKLCLCWDCEAIREAVANSRPKNESELAEIMEVVRGKVACYRNIEIARRGGGKKTSNGPQSTEMRETPSLEPNKLRRNPSSPGPNKLQRNPSSKDRPTQHRPKMREPPSPSPNKLRKKVA